MKNSSPKLLSYAVLLLLEQQIICTRYSIAPPNVNFKVKDCLYRTTNNNK